MSRLRALVPTKTTALGGVGRLVTNTLPHLDTKAFDYRIAALDAGGPLAIACAVSGRAFAPLPHRAAADPRTALARALQHLRADPGPRARLGRAAARDARRRFDVRRQVSALQSLYRKTCCGAAPGWRRQDVARARAT